MTTMADLISLWHAMPTDSVRGSLRRALERTGPVRDDRLVYYVQNGRLMTAFAGFEKSPARHADQVPIPDRPLIEELVRRAAEGDLGEYRCVPTGGYAGQIDDLAALLEPTPAIPCPRCGEHPLHASEYLDFGRLTLGGCPKCGVICTDPEPPAESWRDRPPLL
jgi:hypothetical protein